MADPKPMAAEKVAERPDRVSAQLSARLQKTRVEIAGERTATTSTFANPDGTFTSEMSAVPFRAKNAQGQWGPIDLSLVEDGKVLRPKAGTSDVAISATGGTAPFATVKDGKKSLSLLWPTNLPKPEVSGATATYRDAVPGGDLVVHAVDGGVRYDLVLREKPAEPLVLRLPLKSKGLKVKAAKGGGFTITDDKSKPIGGVPTPVMWDDTADKASKGQTGEQGKTSDIDHSLEKTADGQALVLRPDQAFLDDPAVKYPVVVDPTLTIKADGFTYTKASAPTTAYPWDSWLEAGSVDGNDSTRALIRFSGAGDLAGKQIISAKTKVWSQQAPSCNTTGAGVEIRRVTSPWDDRTVTWNTQPTTTAEGSYVSTEAYGASGCGANFMTFDSTKIAQDWADGLANQGIELRGAKDQDATTYRKFTRYSPDTEAPRMEVTYNAPPDTPHNRVLTPYKDWNSRRYSGINPALSAEGWDNDGGLLRLDFEVAKAGDGTVLWTGASSKEVAVGEKTTVNVPPGVLSEGLEWKWRVRSFDGFTYSHWTDWWYHTADGVVPQQPYMWCDGYNQNQWNAKRTDAVKCTFDSTADDVTGYTYSIDDPKPGTAVANSGGGAPADFWIKPKDGWHTVHFTTHDALGNVSAVSQWDFGVGNGGLISPRDQGRTQQFIPLRSSAKWEKTAVTYQYRPAHHSGTAWGDIPKDDVTVPGTGQALGSWPFIRTDTHTDFAQLDWDVTKSLGRWGKGDGPVEVKACYSESAGGWDCTEPNTITVQRTAFAASHATQTVGPGRLALHTGDYSLNSTDASFGGVSVERGHTTLNPAMESGQEEQLAGFEPNPQGWTSWNATAGPWQSDEWATEGTHSLRADLNLAGPEVGLNQVSGRNFSGKTRLTAVVRTAPWGNHAGGTQAKLYLKTGSGWNWYDNGLMPVTADGTTLSLDLTTIPNSQDVKEIGVAFAPAPGANGQSSVYLDDVKVSSSPQGVFGPGWRAGFPNAEGAAGYTFKDFSAEGYVQLTGISGDIRTFLKQEGGIFAGADDAGDSGVFKQDSATKFTFTEPDGVKTVFVYADGAWGPDYTDAPGDENTVTYIRDTKGRVTQILGKVPAGVSCTASSLRPGCVALRVVYADATTASGVGSGWGEYKGNVQRVEYTAWAPETGGMKTTTVTQYLYDSRGHLRQVWDPRITPNLRTTYYYNDRGSVSQLTLPGQAPWKFEYDTTNHRLAHVSRTDEQNRQATQAVVYDVPITGPGAPIDLSAAQTATWAQTSDLPVEGTAVFPASRVPARNNDGGYSASPEDWKSAALSYQDVDGRTVDSAAFGAGAWQIAATRYDAAGRPVWKLGAENRIQALAPTGSTDPYVAGRGSSMERADLLASVTVFSGAGDKVSETGPTFRAQLNSGAIASIRQQTTFTYDEGKPDSDAHHLVTTTKVKPLVVDGTAPATDADARTTKNGYDALKVGDPTGWELKTPTSTTTVMAGGAVLTTRSRQDRAGRIIEAQQPASNGSDAGTTATTYYTAGTNPVSACGLKPHWAGLTCQIGPKAQPSGKPLPTSAIEYGYQGETVRTTERSGSTTRITSAWYDVAGRKLGTSQKVTPEANGGLPLADTTVEYDANNGQIAKTTAAGKTITSGYDSFGRVTSYTDATGNTATTTYALDDKVATHADGKGTYAFTYDGSDGWGREERRGLVTKVDISAAGEFKFSHNAEGAIVGQNFGTAKMQRTFNYNNNGDKVQAVYANDAGTMLSFKAVGNSIGQTVSQSGPVGSQQYAYDNAGRLTKVADTYEDRCTTRAYGFDANSNRTSQTTYGPHAGACNTSSGSVEKTNAFDAADRITNAGYGYDDLGRSITVPAEEVSGGVELEIGYHTNDKVASLTQGSKNRAFGLDPAGRINSMIETVSGGVTAVVNHYAGADDNPTWITEADGSWTRNIAIGDGLGALQTSHGKVTLQLANLHGDVVATVANGDATGGISAYFEQTEFGTPRAENTTNPTRYGWLGAHQRSSDALGGLTLMGARLYSPQTGRFLQTDPVPGGSATAYDYANADPVNQQDLDGLKAKPAKQAAKVVAKPPVKPAAPRRCTSRTETLYAWWAHKKTQQKGWRYALTIDWCYKNKQIVSISPPVGRPHVYGWADLIGWEFGETQMTKQWDYFGDKWVYRSFVQGKFSYCPAKLGWCPRHFYPWIQIDSYADGRSGASSGAW